MLALALAQPCVSHPLTLYSAELRSPACCLPSQPGPSPLLEPASPENVQQLLETPQLAPEMLKLAVADALGFDATTQTGGPDGSIALEMDK